MTGALGEPAGPQRLTGTLGTSRQRWVPQNASVSLARRTIRPTRELQRTEGPTAGDLC